MAPRRSPTTTSTATGLRWDGCGKIGIGSSSLACDSGRACDVLRGRGGRRGGFARGVGRGRYAGRNVTLVPAVELPLAIEQDQEHRGQQLEEQLPRSDPREAALAH